jgi:hypothetical protein
LPDAAAVKVTDTPAVTEWMQGMLHTAGAAMTVSVAHEVVAEPTLLVNTAW